MPVFKNISEVLKFVGGSARFMPVALPYGFNHWSEGARQIREDNPKFTQDNPLDGAKHEVGVLASHDDEGKEVIRGFMVIYPGSRYVCSDWTKRVGLPVTVVQAGLLGIAVRKGLITLRGGK